MQKKILIIGAVPHPDDLRTYGGTTTLMQNFLDYCDEHHYKYQHIDTFRYRNKWVNLAYFVLSFIRGVLTSRVVMYNLSLNGAFVLFYYTAPFAYALGRKVVFRKFGGNFLNQLQECPVKKRLRMVKLLNSADVMYFETKKLMDAAPKLFRHPERIHWFPNCRKPPVATVDGGFRKRFVFISRMEEAKGVDYLLEVAETLPEGYTVHFYGPLIDSKYAAPGFFEGRRAEYHGAVKTEGVLRTLKAYEVLVLPSHWQTEGYPGIIIEALSLGMPVVSTRIGGIPEMVEDGVNGFLVEPRDPEALRAAMLAFNEQNYGAMSRQARRSFDNVYNSDRINEQVYRTIVSL